MSLEDVVGGAKDLEAGAMVIIVDDEDRENEGDLVLAAEKVTPESINFMATFGKGLICVPMLGERLDKLRLPLMVETNTASLQTAFTVSVDSLKKATTGISAQDRSATIEVLIDDETEAEDLGRPGHIFPLKYMEGGVLKRAGQTEASIDLCRIAGLKEAAVICEIMAEDGRMARMEQLKNFAEVHNLRIVSVAEARVPTKFGEFNAISYSSLVDSYEHVAMVKGVLKPDSVVLVRVHSECLTGDVFGSERCDCGDQIPLALEAIGKEGAGVFLYMRQEGRGIGIHNKLKAYALQDEGYDTVDANIALGFSPDPRQYGVGAQILEDLGVKRMRLMTNNPTKRVGLESFGLEVVERISIGAPYKGENLAYMETKRKRMGHMISDGNPEEESNS